MEIFPVGSLPPGHKKLSRLSRRGWRTIAARREFTGDLRHVVHWNCDSRTTILQNAVVLALSPKKVGREDYVVEQRVHAIARQKWLLSNHCWLKIPSQWSGVAVVQEAIDYVKSLVFWPRCSWKGRNTPPGLSRAVQGYWELQNPPLASLGHYMVLNPNRHNLIFFCRKPSHEA